MLPHDFDFELPPDRIATHPAARRDESRLLIMDRIGGGLRHRRFGDLADEMRPGDCLVINDSRVIPARLFARRGGGGRAEFLLLGPEAPGRWRALVRPGRKIRPGDRLELTGREGAPPAWIRVEAEAGEAERVIAFESALAEAEVLEIYGRIPLPPYIVAARKAAGEADTPAREREDRERYQTVYADPAGSVAAPTAGLHFTPELLRGMADRGVDVRRITLHVGPGTFAPVKAGRIEDHVMHAEAYRIGPAEARAIDEARADPARRVIAVGTTVTRALEACFRKHAAIVATEESTDLMILPGFEFRVVDGLITNFHLPRSTLLMLVAAFAGREAVLNAYREAVASGYRFYSYGDAMFIR